MSYAIVLVLFAALQWGLAGGIASLLMNQGYTPITLVFVRVAIGLVFMTGWVAVRLIQTRRWVWQPRLLVGAALAGLGVTGNLAFYFVSIREGSVAIAVTLMYSAPVMAYLIAFATGSERPNRWNLSVIAAVVVGIGLLTEVYQASPDAVTAVGLIAGLLSGLSYVLFIYAFKAAGPYGSTPVALMVAFAVATLALLPLVNLAQVTQALTSDVATLFVVFGFFGAGLSFYCYFWGLRGVLPTTASVVAMVEPVTAAAFGLVMLGEQLSWVQAMGMTIILAAVTLLSAKRV